jgi:alkylation response protein AidB-like acyl-CoA dehydrogenase
VDFTLTPDQELLVSSLDTVLAGACPPSVVRAVSDGDRDAARAAAAPLADFAALGDGSVVDHVLAAERIGRAAAPGPWLVASSLAVPLLRAAGHELADAVAAGERAATVAWAGDDGVWSVPPPEGGTRTFVLELDLADDVVVVAADGITVVPADTADGAARRIGWLDLTRTAWEVAPPPETAAGSHALTRDAAAVSLGRATVVLAAESCGVARRLLDLSVAYAGERVQFDRPIGSFQAVQHRLADLALDVERSWACVTWAAMCLDEPENAGADVARAPHIAKAAASEAAVHAARSSIQVHGGIGYTWEHDLHLWLRRASTDAHLMGTAHEHHDVLAGLLM